MREKQQRSPRAVALLAVAGCVVTGLTASAVAAPALATPASRLSPASPGLKVTGQPVGIAADPTRKAFWVAESNVGQSEDIVGRIGETSHAMTGIEVPSGLNGIAADPSKGLVWTIGNSASGTTHTVTFVEEASISGDSIPQPADSALEGIAINPTTGKVFVLDEGGDIFVYNEALPDNAPSTLITGSLATATGLAIDPAAGKLFVADASDNSVLTFNDSTGAQIGSPIKVGAGPATIAVDTKAKTVWVADSDGTVSEFAEARPGTVHTLTLDGQALAIAADPQTAQVWIGTSTGTISGFTEKTSPPSAIGNLSVGSQVDGLATDSTTDQLWATENKAGAGASDNVVPFVPSAAKISSPASSWLSVNNSSERSFQVRTSTFPPAHFTLSGAPGFVKIGKLTGLLTGTLTPKSKLGSVKFTIRASNGIGAATSQAFTLNLGTTPAGVSTTATFVVGVKNTFQIKAKATPAATFQGLGLPAGLTLSKTGVLSGTIKKGTKSPVTFNVETSNKVTQAFSSPVSSLFTLKLVPGKNARITTKSSVSFKHGARASFTVKATGSPLPTLTEKGRLPKGLSFRPAKNGTATISGTPAATDAGHTTKVTITATNGVGKKATQTLTIKIT